jgi:20S proteasome alpha/beta subunit
LSTSTSEPDFWRTATMSGGGNCVQVKSKDGMVIIGNSRLSEGPFLSYTRDEWVAFLDGAKKGEFDDLL